MSTMFRLCRCTVWLFFSFFFFSSITRHTRARTSSYPPTPRRPLVTISLNLDTYDSLTLPCLSFHTSSHSPRPIAHSLSLSLPLFLSVPFSRLSFISTKGATVSFKTIPYTRPASALIDYDAYCIEKGCPPVVDSIRKGFPAWTVRRSLCSPSPRQENPRESVHGYMQVYVCVCGCLRQPCYVYKRNPDLDVRRLIAGLTLIRLRRYDHGPYPPLRHPHHLFEKKLHPSLEEYDHRASSRCLR